MTKPKSIKTDRELLQQALDALKHLCLHSAAIKGYDGEQVQTAIVALRARLAQPEPEPVAFMDYFGQVSNPDENQCYIRWTMRDRLPMEEEDVLIPLYTAPPQREWVGLTDEDMAESPHNFDFIHGARWAEDRLKEKNG